MKQIFKSLLNQRLILLPLDFRLAFFLNANLFEFDKVLWIFLGPSIRQKSWKNKKVKDQIKYEDEDEVEDDD